MMRLEQHFPLRDPALKHLAENAEGSMVYPGGMLTSPRAVEKRARHLKGWTGDRKALHSWLSEQNSFADLHPNQKKHLGSVASPDTLFLLTGQQPGLLGGPMLWYCKAMTCAAWARKLSLQLNRSVIPLFWVAGDDSDLAECNVVEWLEPEADRTRMSLDFPHPLAAIPMSLRRPDDWEWKKLFQVIGLNWDAESVKKIQSCYTPGCSLTEGFLQLAQSFLAEEGMLFVDGLSASGRAQPFLQRLIREAPQFQKALGQGIRRMQDARLSVQVPLRPGSVPAFLFEDGVRKRLFFSDTQPQRVFTQGAEAHDLLPAIEKHALLHSALSRPLVAETLFPVLGHILGPGEIRYFGELSEVFPAFGFFHPLLAPRQHLLVSPEKDWKRLQDLGILAKGFPELDPSQIRSKLVELAWERHSASKTFPMTTFKKSIQELRQFQATLPPYGALDAGLRKLEGAFERYRLSARQAVFTGKEAEALTELLPLLRWLGHGFQDRHLNLFSLRKALGEEGFKIFSTMLREGEGQLTVALY